MTDSENPSDKIKRLMRESVPHTSGANDFAASRKRKRRAPATPVVRIVGDSNHIQINGRPPPRRRTRVRAEAVKRSAVKDRSANRLGLIAIVVFALGVLVYLVPMNTATLTPPTAAIRTMLIILCAGLAPAAAAYLIWRWRD